MIRTALSALFSHWRRNPLQLAMLLLGLSLATALWSGVQAVNSEARASYDRATAIVGGNRLDQLVSGNGAPIAQQTYVELRRAGWQVSPVVEGDLRLGSVRLHVVGIDPVTLPADAAQIDVSEGGDLLSFIRSPGLVFVAPETFEELSRGNETALTFRAAADVPPGNAIMDIGNAQLLLGRPGQISSLVVANDQVLDADALKALAPDLVVKSPDGEGDLARLTDSFHLNLTAFGFLAFAVGLFIVYSAVGMAFEQRRSTFRTLRSLGLSARALCGLLVLELLSLALAAGLSGVVLGYLVASLLLPDVAAALQGLYGASLPGTLALRPEWWATGIAIAVGGTLVSAAGSLWRVWRLPLLASAQPRAWALSSERALILQALAGIVAFILAAGLAQWGRGLVSGFGVLGGLLLGAALILPMVLSALLGVLRQSGSGPLAQWFWADARQQLPGLSLALMALLLALSANVGVGTMVSSFRQTFTGWLDQRLAAELYVTARSDAEGDRIRHWLSSRASAVLPIWNVDGEVEGNDAEIFGIKDDPLYRENWPLLQSSPDVWDRVAEGNAALINEQMSRRDRLDVGDDIVLPGGWATTVAGVFSDYGNPKGQVIIGIDRLSQLYPQVPRLRYGVRIAPSGAGALTAALIEEFDLPRQNVVDQDSLKRRSLEVFEKTFSVTAVLNVLTLGVAGLAMFASLVTLAGMRLPQIAPLWAMGITLRRIVLLELVRTLALALLTLIAALPVGLGLAWVLLSIVNVEAFSWKLPMHLFPGDWLKLGGLAMAAALVAAIIPLRRLARTSAADLLKVFANER
ncbi:MAG: FtsX-like permease family protein [Rhizobium sp.]|nr:FtsX-like permease family protein [Rhizobium sp.]